MLSQCPLEITHKDETGNPTGGCGFHGKQRQKGISMSVSHISVMAASDHIWLLITEMWLAQMEVNCKYKIKLKFEGLTEKGVKYFIANFRPDTIIF